MKKILSLTLVFAMLLSLCPTAFAAPTFDDSTNTTDKYLFFPIGNHAVHHSYSATDTENPVSYRIQRYSGSEYDPAGTHINSDGLFSLYAGATAGTNNDGRYHVYANETKSGKIFSYTTYSNDFEDGILTTTSSIGFVANAVITSDGSNHYMVSTHKDGQTRFRRNASNAVNNLVMEFDVKIDGTPFSLYVQDGQQDLISWNKDNGLKDGTSVVNGYTDISRDWHNVKVVMNWVNLKYSAFFDNVLIADNKALVSKDTTTGFYIYDSGGIDNFKYYGSSLDFPHSISVSGTAKEGETLTVSALKSAGENLVPSSLDYKFLVCDTIDGTYREVVASNEYEIADGLGGKYIKAAARVKESDSIYGEWIYSEPQLVATAAKPFAWTNKISDIYAPHGNDVYKFHFTHSGGGYNKTVIHGGTTTGMTLADHLADGYVLTVTSDAGAAADDSASGKIQTQIISRANTDGRAYVNVKNAKVYDFEDESTSGFSAYPEIKTEDNGNKYLGHTKYIRYIFPTDISDTIAIDFDILTETMSEAYLRLDNDQEISLVNLWGNPQFKDLRSAKPYTTVNSGWNHVRIYIDLTDKVYSMFIDGKPLSVNNEIPGYEDDISAKLSRIDFYASIDNFTFANVTPATPVAYNAKLGNIAAGRQNYADYDFYLGGTPDKCSALEWYVSDNFATGYTLVSEDKAFAPTADMVGKYVKARITPASEAFFETFTGAAVETLPQLITDVAIGDITLMVDGVDADITKANIADQAAGVTNTIALTIPASSLNSGKKVLFALAQYDNNGLCAVDSESATLGIEAQNVSLTLTASEVGELTYFKLLVLDEATLTPIQNVIFLR